MNQAHLNLRSLAYRTDLSMLSFQGKVADRGAYVVAESPGNPAYFWGNLLIMKNPPQTGDFQKWHDVFQKEFSHHPLVRHMTFGWDSPEAEEGETGDFIRQGFEVQISLVLTLRREKIIQPKSSCNGLEIRILESDEDWHQALENQVACRQEHFKEELYIPFKQEQMRKYRAMSEAGLGHWYGAFLNGRLAGDCGMFISDKTGRFQSVGTHPAFRNRGICGNLIHHISHRSLSTGLAQTLVMVADPEYHAARVYESIGFQATEKQIGMYRWPKEEWTA